LGIGPNPQSPIPNPQLIQNALNNLKKLNYIYKFNITILIKYFKFL